MTRKTIWLLGIMLFLVTYTAQAEPIRLRFATIGTVRDGETWQMAIDMWNQRHPDVQVELEMVPGGWQGLYERLVLESVSGNPPDIARVGLATWPVMRDQALLADMLPLLRAHEFRFDDYFPVIYAYEENGTMYGLSSSIYVLAEFINKDVFDTSGVALPATDWATTWTWDEYRDAARKLTVRSGDNVTRWGTKIYTIPERIIQFIWQNGGDWLTPDQTRSALTSPEAIEALQWISDLINVDQSAVVATGDLEFSQSRLAIHMNGPWYVPPAQVTYGLAPLPRGKAGPATPLFIDPYVLLQGSRHHEEAVAVLEFFLGPEVSELFVQRNHLGIPLHIEEATRSLPDMFGPLLPHEKMVWIDAIPYARNVPFTGNWATLAGLATAELGRLVRNEAPAETVAQEIARRSDALLSEYYGNR